MGFEQLAQLRDRLRSEKLESKNAKPQHPKRAPAPKAKQQALDPAVEAIRPLQEHFPLAFPVNPKPKVPLKEGIFKDAEQHLELLGLTSEQLKLGIFTWCRGARYWASMVENAPRFDLSGQAVGIVSATQALHAKRQSHQDRRHRAKLKSAATAVSSPVPDSASGQAKD
jgi:ProP effector